MRIAFFADVHANFEALTACLAHAERSGAGRFVFLGDHVGYGADPERVLESIMALVNRGAIAVLGNHDAAAEGEVSRQMNTDARTAIEWTRRRLDSTHREFLAGLPLVVEENGRLYAHANGWAPGDWEYVGGTAEADRSLRATSCGQSFFGHVHQPMLYHRSHAAGTVAFEPVPGVGVPLSPTRRWLCLSGSVGQPRDGNPAACYALLDDSRALLTFHRVPYDAESAARKIRAAGLPESLSVRLEKGI
jgi:diadenosine tetraphosphatase ApaH/serine/threonine PP2A family protein phosphatase